MAIALTTRSFYASELRALKAIRKIKEKEVRQPVRYYLIVFCALATAGALWIVFNENGDAMFTLVAGAIALVAGLTTLMLPYYLLTQRRNIKAYLAAIDAAIIRGTVDTYVISTKRIALAENYEDEGDLYIIEYDANSVLYLWDVAYELENKRLSTHFEIYENDFACLVRRLVYHQGERLQPILIDPRAKWSYFKEKGAPAQLQTQAVHFDQLVASYNSFNDRP